MYLIRYSFNFRYDGTRINVDIPADEYIASGREIDVYEVWELIRENDAIRDQISVQQPKFEDWMSRSDIYDKSLQRQGERLNIVKAE